MKNVVQLFSKCSNIFEICWNFLQHFPLIFLLHILLLMACGAPTPMPTAQPTGHRQVTRVTPQADLDAVQMAAARFTGSRREEHEVRVRGIQWLWLVAQISNVASFNTILFQKILGQRIGVWVDAAQYRLRLLSPGFFFFWEGTQFYDVILWGNVGTENNLNEFVMFDERFCIFFRLFDASGIELSSKVFLHDSKLFCKF